MNSGKEKIIYLSLISMPVFVMLFMLSLYLQSLGVEVAWVLGLFATLALWGVIVLLGWV